MPDFPLAVQENQALSSFPQITGFFHNNDENILFSLFFCTFAFKFKNHFL